MVQTTPEDDASKKITSRLKRSRGQLDAVLRMMDEGKPPNAAFCRQIQRR